MRQVTIIVEDGAVHGAGYLGEHNATTINLTPPVSLLEASDTLRVAFQLSSGVVRSDAMAVEDNAQYSLPLGSQLTQETPLVFTLEGYTSDGQFVGKSPTVTLVFAPAVTGPDIDPDDDSRYLAAEVAQNTIIAVEAAENANSAADAANAAAELANTAAETANTAAGLADAATSDALDAADAANEAAEIADTKQDKYIPTDTTGSLPIYSDAGKTIRCTPSSAGEIITSNGNFIGALRFIEDGTYSFGGSGDSLTMTISEGNKVKLTGVLASPTTSGSIRLSESFATGLANMTLRTFEYPVPLLETGLILRAYDIVRDASSPLPTVAIRNKTAGGNILTLQISGIDVSVNLPQSQYSDYGSLFVSLAKGTYDCEFKLTLALDNSEKYRVSPTTEIVQIAGGENGYIKSLGAIASTVSTEYTEVISVNDLCVGLYNDYDVDNWSQSDDIILIKRPRISSSPLKPAIYVFVPTKTFGKYVNYEFSRHTNLDADKNFDLWRLNSIRIRDGLSFTSSSIPFTGGEFDFGVRANGWKDFIGGSYHGDEIATSVDMYIDGLRIADNLVEDVDEEWVMRCKEFKCVQQIDMYDPQDNITKVGTHQKLQIWTRKEHICENQVVWGASLTMIASVLWMLPFLRRYPADVETPAGSGNWVPVGNQLSDRCMDDNNYVIYDITDNDNPPAYPKSKNTGISRVNIWGELSGIQAEITQTRTPNLTSNHVVITANERVYNKVYFYFNDNGVTVSSGDKWRATTKVRIDYVPPTI